MIQKPELFAFISDGAVRPDRAQGFRQGILPLAEKEVYQAKGKTASDTIGEHGNHSKGI